MIRLIPFLVALLVAFAAADAGAPIDAELAEDGAKRLQPFKRDMKQALMSGLQQGTDRAIDACRLEAPAIAGRHGNDSVLMGRTSHKLRNPANAPPDWVAPLLAEYVDSTRSGPSVVQIDDDTAGYIEPIMLQPVCLACHGSAIAPDVAAKIDAAYPDDQATGFAEGELRGLWWIRFPIEEAR